MVKSLGEGAEVWQTVLCVGSNLADNLPWTLWLAVRLESQLANINF